MKRIKRILLVVGLAVLGLIVVVVVNTLRFSSRQVQIQAVRDITVDSGPLAERLAKAIQFKTIAYTNPDAFLGLLAYLEQAFPTVHESLVRQVVNDYSLLFRWPGSEPNRKPVLLMAHLDVVPVEPGTEEKWVHPPFSGRIADGFVWGRGTLDDKASALAILEAVEYLLQADYRPERTIYLAFGHDEEVGGKKGAAQIATLLTQQNVQLEYVLDEGLGITQGLIPGVSCPAALIGIAEKGYVSVELSVRAEGGHSSMPPPHTAIGVLSAAVCSMERNPMPARLDGAVRTLFEVVGPEMTFSQRLVFANLWLFGPLVKRQLAASPATNAGIRTTTAATVIEGGVKYNVLPGQARAVLNFRILPGDSAEAVLDHIRKTIDDDRIAIKVVEGPDAPSLVSNVDAPGYRIIERTIRQVCSDVVVAPALVLGATDSRHFAGLTKNIYRFSPSLVTGEHLARVHGTNERIAVENYAELVRFYVQLLRNSDH